ncbi:MAG: hypothetical protein LBD23_20515 [Oscillospiraceae bacterium]|jgi:hypothetical protein|nr:hypothetical protein [Oscillospiraceae bacterium]
MMQLISQQKFILDGHKKLLPDGLDKYRYIPYNERMNKNDYIFTAYAKESNAQKF